MIAQLLTPAAHTAGWTAASEAFRWLIPAVETAALASGNWPMMRDPAPSEWTCFPRVASRTVGMDASAVPGARDFAVATVHRWGAGERSGDVAVVVSELLTNALRHALPARSPAGQRRAIRLALLQPGPCVLCAVADPSRTPPARQEPTALAETGRGLHVVGAFSDSWGYAALGEQGKVVWATFSTVPRSGTEPASSRPTEEARMGAWR